MRKVTIKAGRERSVLKFHPWIFSGALDLSKEVRPVLTIPSGETVAVVSAKGETLGCGWYSPESQIRVRMLTFGAALPDDPVRLVRERVAAAVARRADFFASASTTDACRLVNAESDGLPGVVADRYGAFVVCQFTSAGADRYKAEIASALLAHTPGCRGVSERADLKDRAKEGLPVEPVFATLVGEEPPAEIEIREGRCRYLVDVRKGHKTGFYLDQRDARAAVAALANGREVLNCFSYTGGFGIAAALGGAAHVVQVDVSGDALALASRNAALSDAPAVIDTVEADVFEYLRKCRDAGKRFDLIVLDPPKFASVRSQVMKAARGYKDINLLAMKLLKPGGHLATFSCSGAMTPELFDQVLAEAAVDARRQFQMLARTRQGTDHPVDLAFPEGFYLKGVILRARD